MRKVLWVVDVVMDSGRAGRATFRRRGRCGRRLNQTSTGDAHHPSVMMRVNWRKHRFFSAEIEPGKGAWTDQWLWTLYLRGEIVGTGYAEDRNAAIAAASEVAEQASRPRLISSVAMPPPAPDHGPAPTPAA